MPMRIRGAQSILLVTAMWGHAASALTICQSGSVQVVFGGAAPCPVASEMQGIRRAQPPESRVSAQGDAASYQMSGSASEREVERLKILRKELESEQVALVALEATRGPRNADWSRMNRVHRDNIRSLERELARLK